MGALKQLDHEKFMRAKGIETADLPKELQEASEKLKEAKKNDFDAANEVSKLIVEALQESIYEINDTIEKIGETLADHENRLEALEQENKEQEKQIEQLEEEVKKVTEQVEENTETSAEEQPETSAEEQPETETPAESQEIFSSKEEAILAQLHAEGIEYITKPELKALGFNTGFWSKLTIRGATYGAYKLQKAPSEKVFRIVKLV